jgi:hypothetical protein
VRPLRYSINITLDGCCDHRAVTPDENLHRHATEMLARADALPTVFAGLSKSVDLKLVGRREFDSGAVALRYERRP